jgi:hypothetical protein
MNKMTKLVVTALLVGAFTSGIALNGVASVNAEHKVTIQQTEVAHKKLLDETMVQAKQGKLVASEKLGIGSTQKDIVAKWGKPDAEASDEFLWNYAKHDVTFYFAEDNSVISLASGGNLYYGVTYTEVKKTLGEPTYEVYVKGERNVTLVYEVNQKYEWSIQFRTDKDGNKREVVGVELQKAWR